jgi:VWFA-related protein
MFINARPRVFLVAGLLFGCAASAQQQKPLTLDVVVTAKSGLPVSDLQQQDFTLLDNKVPQTITSFRTVDGRQAPIEVVLVVDAVNTGYDNVAYERNQIDKFLRADAGKLANPTTLAVLTDTGMQFHQDFSTDGNVLSTLLDQYTVSLRNVRRTDGFFGDEEIFQVSLQGLQDLVDRETQRPGRKVILWVSPGWPLLSGPNVELDDKEQQRLFTGIVSLSTKFLQGRLTLYSIDPLGTADAGTFRVFFWKDFVKGVSKSSQVQIGDLGLEVIATQSGGLALNSSNDIAVQLQKCIADLGTYYELSFKPPLGDKPNEYHQLEIRIAKRGLTARTRQGYYSQP